MAFLKNMWKNNSKHKKLLEELALQNNKDSNFEQTDVTETDSEITFKLKYLGSTVIEKVPIKENINTEAVKTVVKTSKASRKKPQRVNLTVSLKGITVADLQGNELLNVSIYRISNCSTDATQKQVFSFISTDQNETMECHAFMCSKRKMAEAVTLTVAEAFQTAYADWQAQPQITKNLENNEKLTNDNNKRLIENSSNNIKETPVISNESNQINNHSPCLTEEKLIDLDSEVCTENNGFPFKLSSFDTNFNAAARWVCFEDDFSSAFGSESGSISRKSHADLVLA